MPTDRPMTPEQVAEIWGCSANHVRNLINRGELRAWRLGSRLLRIPPEAVAEFEQRRQITSSAPPASPAYNDPAESVIAVALFRAMKNSPSAKAAEAARLPGYLMTGGGGGTNGSGVARSAPASSALPASPSSLSPFSKALTTAAGMRIERPARKAQAPCPHEAADVLCGAAPPLA